MKKAFLKGKANEILTTFHSSYTALGFSQSEALRFFVYIFSVGNNMISSAIWC